MDKRCSCLRVCVLGPPGRGLVEPSADVARKDGGVRSMRFDGQREAERARMDVGMEFLLSCTCQVLRARGGC